MEKLPETIEEKRVRLLKEEWLVEEKPRQSFSERIFNQLEYRLIKFANTPQGKGAILGFGTGMILHTPGPVVAAFTVYGFCISFMMGHSYRPRMSFP